MSSRQPHAALPRLVNEREPKQPLLRLPRPFEGCEPPLRHNLRGGERVLPGKERQPVSSGVRGEDVRRGRREDKMLKEAAPPIEELTSMRNAGEHPDGYSGKLVVANFTLVADRRIDEPTWHREQDGNATGDPSSSR